MPLQEEGSRALIYNIDECASSPCQNGGTCDDNINYYTCTCAAGYTGTDCPTDIDECASSPCQNGGTCEDNINFYTCTCAAGYTGTHCETDIPACQSNPCVNGLCQEEINGYTCTCTAGWYDTHCDSDTLQCLSCDKVTDLADCTLVNCKGFITKTHGIEAYCYRKERNPGEYERGCAYTCTGKKAKDYLECCDTPMCNDDGYTYP